MKKPGHIHLVLFFVLFGLTVTVRAQLCLSIWAQPYYNCVTGLANTNYTLSGGNGVYTFTIVDAATNATVSTGSVAGTTGTMTALPQGNYNIYMSDAAGCNGNSLGYLVTANLLSAGNPSLTTTTVTCYGANNASATVTPPTSFSANPGYTWMPGNVNTPTITNMIGGLTYTVTIRDVQGCETKTYVTVSQPPPINSVLGGTHIPCYGGVLNTPITTTGNVGVTTYSINGNPVLGANAINLSAGIITINTRDARPCVQTNTVLITQGPQPMVSVPANFKFSPTCPGGTDGSMVAVVSNVPPPYSYVWQPGGGGGASIANIAAGVYSLSVGYGTTTPQCFTTIAVTLDPAVDPTVTAITVPENCSAMDGAYTVNVAGVAAPFTYTLFTPDLTNSVVAASVASLSSGVYTLITGYKTQCRDTLEFIIDNLSTVSVSIQNSVAVQCNSSCNASVTLNVINAVAPITYSATGQPSSAVNAFNNLCAGLYLFRVKDANGCPATASLNLVEPAALSYSATGPASVCVGRPANLKAKANGGTGNYTHFWQPGNTQGPSVNVFPTVTTVYSLTTYDSNGCTKGVEQVTINVAPQLSVFITAAGSGICPGSTAQITPTVSGGDGDYSYFWQPGNQITPSIFVENITVPVYTLTVKDGCGSPTAVKNIPVNLHPQIQPKYITKASKGCAPLCTRFINVTPKSSAPLWGFGDKPGLNTGDTTNYCYLTAGRFNLTLSVIDSNLCRSSFTYSNAVEVRGSPNADFVTLEHTLTLFSAENIEFRNATTDALNYQWFVENDYLGSAWDMKYSFRDTGDFHVRLVATNSNNCRDTAVQVVHVQEDFSFYMPTSFTPDGNGNNDAFLPKGTGWQQKGYVFEVYDRWGAVLFSTHDMTAGWDGNFSGQQPPYNTYAWRVVVNDLRNKSHRFAGTVTLVR